tara:strand:+ start:961 stop:2025 length:1065 start_codon:yes stop_codon:yes gene_type:complete
MSKVVLVTDTHWGARNDSRVFAKYFSRFWNDVFFPYIDEHNIDNVIHLGDIVDRRKYINYVTADNLKKDFINPLKERNIKFWCLIGNHDIYYRNSLEINALDQLYGLNEDINLVTEPQEINIDGCDMLLMPWICKDNWDDSWKSIKYSKSQIMLGHLELNGFEMHRGAICETGFDLGEFSKFDMVLSGHFHHKSSNGNIHYLGSPYEITWSDYQDTKGFHVFDTETRELEFIKNPYSMFYKYMYDDTNMKIEELEDMDLSMYEDCYMKVIIQNKTNPYLFDLFIDRLSKIGVHDLQIVEDLFNLDMDNESDIIDEAKSTMEMLQSYVEQIDTNVNKKKLTGLFQGLYNEAMALE